MRSAFIDELAILARKNSRIFLVVGDLGFSVVEPFATEFPDRFLNAGVAEQNMTGVAAGLASEGYHVFTYSIANFPTFRCFEQIRNDVAYHDLPVTVVAVGGGVAYGSLGYSHHAVQDFALLRSIPNMLIASPGDPLEVRACLRLLVDHPQTSYLRLGKSGEPLLSQGSLEFKPGVPHPVRGAESTSGLILASGAALQLAVEAWDSLPPEVRREWRVSSLPLWGEPCRASLEPHLEQFEKIVTVEEHLLAGGVGSWVLESFPKLRARVSTLALTPGVCGEVGEQKYLWQQGGLSAQAIVALLVQN
jgi:transketolase